MKHDYTKLDAAILNYLKGKQGVLFSDLQLSPSIAPQLRALHLAQPIKDQFRFLDNRLQHLRKAGKIAFSHKHGWDLANSDLFQGAKQ